MANNIGVTGIAQPIDTLSDQDTFPITYANKIKGGYKTVSTLVEMNAIPLERRNGDLIKVEETNTIYHWNGVSYTDNIKQYIGLGNVDNTSDANKPISIATQTALDSKLDVSRAVTTVSPLGIYNPATNIYININGTSGSLPSTPPSGSSNGSYYTSTTSGSIGFAGLNFSSGSLVNTGDLLTVYGTQWGINPQNNQISVDSLLQYSGAINTLGRYLVTTDLLNGATRITDNLGNQSLSIPSGSSGLSSVIYVMNTLSNSVQVAEVGTCTRVFFNVVFEHTSTTNISNILKFKGRYYVSSTSTDADLSYQIIDSTHTRMYGWITVPSNFTAISCYIQFKQTTTFTSNFFIKCISAGYFTDSQLGQTTNERNRTLNPDQSILNLDLYSGLIQDSYYGEAFNGAIFSGRRITIPTGQTGQTSYSQAYISTSKITNFANIIGKSIIIKIIVNTSVNITDLRTFIVNASVVRGGIIVNSVATNTSITKISSSITLITLTYTPDATDTIIKPYFQIRDTTVATSDQYFELADIFYNVSTIPDGYPNKNSYAFIQEIKSVKSLIDAGNQELFTGLIQDSYYGEAFNGAIFSGSRITIPTGQTGFSSYPQALITTSKISNFINLIGKSITFRIVLNTSANITDLRTIGINASVIRGGVSVNSVATNTSITKISSSVSVISFTYIPQSTDTIIKPFAQIKDNTVAISDQYFELADIFYNVSTIPDGTPNKSTYTFTQEIKGIKQNIDSLTSSISTPNVVILTVKRDGTGMFLSPKLANDSIIDSSPLKWYIIDFEGTYIDTEWIIKPFTILRGRGISRSWLKGELADNSTDIQINNTSTIWLKSTSYLENLKITAKNMRYAIHSEGGGTNTDQIHNIFMCYIEHYGNQGAKDWRDANPGSGMSSSTVWSSDRPYGYGSAGGLIENYNDTTFVSNKKESYYVHNNKDFLKPNRNFLKNCTLSRRGTFGEVIVLESLGSGQADCVEITDCNIVKGFIKHNDNPWITEDIYKQYANHAEIRSIISNSSKIGYLDNTRGKALKIESNSILSGSSISVSGTAVPYIFGDFYTKNGGVGLKGYQYGYWDISGILVGISSNISAVNTLGKRLGDCSSVNKTLTVLINGVTTVNIVFSTDLTSVSNATILSTINTALGSNAVASEYNSAEGEHYPYFPDKEQLLTNTSSVGIPRFSAVSYNSDSLSIKLATNTDTVIGFTLERINVGEYGRVLFGGILSKTQLGLSGTVSFGNTYVVDSSNAGKLIAGSTNIVGKAIATDWIEF